MMTSKKANRKPVKIGTLINKLENCYALAVMRGDREAEAKFRAALEMAINSTNMRHYLA